MKLKDFIKMCEKEWEEDCLFEMANLTPNDHGIPGVVIWVGIENKQHALRVKISNKKNRFDPKDNFVIQMPSLDYDHRRVAGWITNKHINAIFDWIKVNQKLLYDYETGSLQSTREFLQQIIPVKVK